MTPARQLITDYVLGHCTDEPLTLRLRLYRALAADLPEKTETFRRLTRMADDLEAIEAAHAQLLLDFRAATKGGRP